MIKYLKTFLNLIHIYNTFTELVTEGKFNTVIEYANKVKIDYPNRPIGFFYCGYGKLKVLKYDESIIDLLTTLDLIKSRNNKSEKKLFLYFTFLNLGSAYDSLKDYKEALYYCEKAIQLQNDKYEAFLNRGIVRMKMNQGFDAVKDFEKVLEIDHGNLIATLNKEQIVFNLTNSEVISNNINKEVP